MARFLSSGDENLLEGPLLGKVFKFILPLMLTNLLQVFYSAADMIIVGMSNVEGAIGAIGTTNSFINLVLNVFMGFSIGANVVVARNIGRGDRDATGKAVHTSLLLGLMSGALCGAVGIAISRPVMILMGDEGHILELAVLYTRIYFIGAPFLALTNFMIAILRAEGDTRTPLFILTISGILNVLLNLVFVLVFGMSVDGVAIATVISNVVSTVLLAIRLNNDHGWCNLDLKKLRLDPAELKNVIHDGIPAGLQGVVFSLSNMLIQSTITGINNTVCPGGSAVIDGNAAASNIEGFAYTATNSVYQAAVTFTSQHFGARKYRRIGSVMKDCYLTTFCISLIAAVLIVTLRHTLVGFYVSSDLAFATAQTRIFVMIIPYFTLAFMEVGSGILRGLGRSVTSTIISLLGSCMLRLLWIWIVFPLMPTLETVYLSYPISWTVTGLTHFICSMTVRKKLIREQESDEGLRACADTAQH